MIKVRYSSCDGFSVTRRFKTLAGAQRFAQEYVGTHPEIGATYAASGDGIGVIRASGASMSELFPEE